MPLASMVTTYSLKLSSWSMIISRNLWDLTRLICILHSMILGRSRDWYSNFLSLWLFFHASSLMHSLFLTFTFFLFLIKPIRANLSTATEQLCMSAYLNAPLLLFIISLSLSVASFIMTAITMYAMSSIKVTLSLLLL